MGRKRGERGQSCAERRALGRGRWQAEWALVRVGSAPIESNRRRQRQVGSWEGEGGVPERTWMDPGTLH